MVSIGPLHKEDTILQEFEGQKVTYLHDLLGGLNTPPKQTLKAYVQKVSGSIERIKGCYARMNAYTNVELTKIMVTDVSFSSLFIFFQNTIKHFRKAC